MNTMDIDKNIYDKLIGYSAGGYCPMHMPGHKRNSAFLGYHLPYRIDITEIDGFDNLHNANGIIKNAMEKAQKLYESEHSFLLVNGSTCGILAAILCATHYGDEIIIARNCHKSVYNGCVLNGLTVHYIYPPVDRSTGVNGSITTESVLAALGEFPKAKAIVLTSPTYEGVISDILSIAEIAHSRNIPVIVDSAHGAHLRFCGYGGKDPVQNGADIVISSLHKTLPSLTQTALANVNGTLVDPFEYQKQLAVFETSSPSYILMASIDQCFDILINGAEHLFKCYEENLNHFSERIKSLKNLTVLCYGNDSLKKHNFFSFDYGKIVISTGSTSINGVVLSQILREKYKIEVEMSYSHYALAMTSICDSKENFDRLAEALIEIDGNITKTTGNFEFPPVPILINSGCTYNSLLNKGELRQLKKAVGRVSLDYVFAYPPGIPLIVPGEIINESFIDYICTLKENGVNVQCTGSVNESDNDEFVINVVV